MSLRLIRALLVTAVIAAGPLLSQNVTGSVQGTVTDPSGAAVARVRVQLTNEGTHTVQEQLTNDQGQYTFNLIPRGVYTVSASLQGFKTFSSTGIAVDVNKVTRIDLKLTLGSVSESVDVSANAVLVDTNSAQVSTNVPSKMVIDLPSSTRNALSYAQMAPGVTIQNGGSQVMNITGTSANVDGNRQARNVYYLDGSDNTGPFRNTALQFPNPEAIAEVNVTTSNSSAEFGKQPGGVFNVITKSGTNTLHGSAFGFLQNEDLNANSWGRNLTGTARAQDRLRQWGGTAGGPIIHDRTFYFVSYQNYHDQAPGFQNTIKFPTQAMDNGNFSQFTQQLYDPDTHKPLPGNIIPQRLIDPVAVNLLKLIPTVPNYGDRYVWSFVDPTQNQEILGKLDHNFTQNQRIEVSYFHTWGHQNSAATSATGNVPAWGPQVNLSNQNTGIVRHTWVIRPNLLLENKFAVGRLDANRTNANTGRDLSDFGANWPLVEPGILKLLPQIMIGDGFKAVQGNLSLFNQYNYRFGSTLSWIRGQHNFKFGYELQRDDVLQDNNQDATSLNFDGRASSTNTAGVQTGINVFGYSMADFLMGRVGTFSVNGLLDYNIHTWSTFMFAQDEWKLTPRLTLTPGLRYEFYRPATEDNNRQDAYVRGYHSTLYPNAPVGIAFAGDPGLPAGFSKPDYNNFAPRMGIAYDMTGNARNVIRASAGYYYSYNPLQVYLWTVEAPPWRPNATGGNTTSLTNIWTTSRTVVYPQPPTPFSTSVANYNYPRLNNIIGFDQNFRTPYSIQWNAAYERQVTGNIAATVSYVANRGYNMLQILPGNLPVWTPTASLNNIDARRPLQKYSNIGIVYSRARSWYDSLQATADIRSLRGLTARFTYVYGRFFDIVAEDPTSNSNIQTANPLNWDGEKAPDGNRHQFRAFYVYDVPAIPSSSGFIHAVTGGWQVSGSVSITSGDFLNVTLGQDWNYDGVAGDRPNLIAPLVYTSGSRDRKSARFFSTNSFAPPTSHNAFGNLPRNALNGPATWSTDMALLRQFFLKERLHLQLRGEAYDVFNHNSLNDPVVAMNSSDFGIITGRSGNRVIQLGARLTF